MSNPAIELTGLRFGHLTVIHRAGTTTGSTQKAIWLCQCDCGVRVCRESQSLRSTRRPNGNHCGCRGTRPPRHGMSNKRPYRIWVHMKRRCYDPTFKDYKNWGARGIRMCEAWYIKFDNFWSDMSNGYSDQLSIDRIDNDGHYEPTNCRWATAKQQVANRRPPHTISRIVAPGTDLLYRPRAAT